MRAIVDSWVKAAAAQLRSDMLKQHHNKPPDVLLEFTAIFLLRKEYLLFIPIKLESFVISMAAGVDFIVQLGRR